MDSKDLDLKNEEGVDSEDENDGVGSKKGRRKIKIEFIEDKSRRHITFSKRKAGIMKKVRLYFTFFLCLATHLG